jgi:hypothetical protein
VSPGHRMQPHNSTLHQDSQVLILEPGHQEVTNSHQRDGPCQSGEIHSHCENRRHKPWLTPGVVADTCNPSTWKAEAADFCQPGIRFKTLPQKSKINKQTNMIYKKGS